MSCDPGDACTPKRLWWVLNWMANPWPAFLEFCHCPDSLEIDATCFSHAGSFWGRSDRQYSIRQGPLKNAQGFSALEVIHHKWLPLSLRIMFILVPLYWLYTSFSSVEFLFGFQNDSSLTQWSPKVKDNGILIRSHVENREWNHSTHHFPFQGFAL